MVKLLYQKNNLMKLFMDQKDTSYFKTLLRNISKMYFRTLYKLLITFKCQHSVPTEVWEINATVWVTSVPDPMH